MIKKNEITKKAQGKYGTPYTEDDYDKKDDIYNKAKEAKFIDECDPLYKNTINNEDSDLGMN